MDSINPKYNHAKAAEDFKSLWLVSTAPQTLLLQTRDPHPKSVTQVRGDVWLFCRDIRLWYGVGFFCGHTPVFTASSIYTNVCGFHVWLFCRNTELFCRDIGLFWTDVGLFCGYTQVFVVRSYSTEDALAAGKGPIYKTKCHTQSMLIRHKYMKGLCACTQVQTRIPAG